MYRHLVLIFQDCKSVSLDEDNWLKRILEENHICHQRQPACDRLFDSYNSSGATSMTFEKININYQNEHNINKKIKFIFHHMGRLGNMMFQYAGMYELSKFYDRELVIDTQFAMTLKSIFKMKSTNAKQRYADIKLGQISSIFPPIGFNLDFFTVHSLKDEKIFSYFVCWKFFQHDSKQIKDFYSFHDNILLGAKETLHELSSNASTIIGIHVRRGDRAPSLRLAPKSYFIKAMAYYKAKYIDIQFIVVSDDYTWCQKHLSHMKDISIMPPGRDRAHDMAAITLCDHVILSVGSFSFWIGYLSKGEVVYFNGSASDHYIMPHWTPLGE